MRFISFVLLSLIASSCNIQTTSEQSEVETDSLKTHDVVNSDSTIKRDSITGDFNGDGKQETAWLVPPEIAVPGESCVGECISTINFSDGSIQPIKIDQCIGGQPINLGDLNDNVGDEIGLNPEWFTSCWSGYKVFTLKNNKPVDLVPPISVHCDHMEQGLTPIQKDKARKGYVIIKSSEMKDTGLVVNKISVKL